MNKPLSMMFGVLVILPIITSGCRIGAPVNKEHLRAQLAVAESFGTGSTEAVRNGWLAAFGDADLIAFVVEALQNNPDLEIAAAQVDRAAGLARQAGALLMPAVDLGAGGYSAGGDRGGASHGGASLDFVWELDIWGRLGSQAAAAKNQYLAAELGYAYGRQSLAAQVAKSWFLCVETHLQVQTAAGAVKIHERIVEITRGKFRLEAVAKNAVQLAEADLASAREARRETMGADQQARRALETLAGRYPSAQIEVTREFAAIPPAIPAGLPSGILERRADIVAAERRVAASFEAVRVAKAARLPRVAITASAGGSSARFQDFGNPSNVFWTVGANLLAPLFDGGFLKAEQDIATADQKAAVAEYRKVGLRAFADVENGLANEKLLAERVGFLREALNKNKQVWELAQKQYEAGAIDLLSVLQLQKRVLNARVALIHLQSRRLADRVNLHLSLGGNFESPEELSHETSD